VPATSRPTLKTLGKALRAMRVERGLSQDRLANLANIDRAYLGGIERAERHPTWEMIELILATLDASWEELSQLLHQRTPSRR